MTFRGSTTLQLQLIDIRPSLTPSRHEAADLDLLHRLVAGEGLTGQERARLQASRSQFAALLDRAGAAAPPGKGGGGDAALSAAAVGTLRRV